MSRPLLPKKVCPVQGKRMFKHYQSAARHARLGAKPRFNGLAEVPQSIYRCEHCEHWHLTSYAPEATRRIQHAKKRRRKKEES